MAINNRLEDVLNLIRPGSSWAVNSGRITLWSDPSTTQPTDQEISNGFVLLAQNQANQAQSISQAKSKLKNPLSTTDDKVTALITLLGF